MPDGLYQRDALLWSEQQADLLRRVADGERTNASDTMADLVDRHADVAALAVRLAEGD